MISAEDSSFMEVPEYNCVVKDEFLSEESSNCGTQLEHTTYEQHENKDENIYTGDSTILDGKYYKVVQIRNNKHVDAICQMCLPNYKIIKGRLQSSSNFLKHMKSSHPEKIGEYTEYKITKRSGRMKGWSTEQLSTYNALLETGSLGEQSSGQQLIHENKPFNLIHGIKEEFVDEDFDSSEDQPSLIQLEDQQECDEGNDDTTKECQNNIDGGAMLDGKFFKIISINDNKLVEAECQMCLPRQKTIKGCVQSSSNFLKHMKNSHVGKISEYNTYKIMKRAARMTMNQMGVYSEYSASNSLNDLVNTSKLLESVVGKSVVDESVVDTNTELNVSDDSNHSLLMPVEQPDNQNDNTVDYLKTGDIQTILDGKFFKVIKIHNKNCVEAECQLCLPINKVIKGNLMSSSNYVKHMKTYHIERMSEYNDYKEHKRIIRRKRKITQEQDGLKTEGSILKYPRTETDIKLFAFMKDAEQQKCYNQINEGNSSTQNPREDIGSNEICDDAAFQDDCVSDDSSEEKCITTPTQTIDDEKYLAGNDNIADCNNLDKQTILDGKFFKVTLTGDKNYVQAECQMCLPKIRIIKGNFLWTSNFVQHMKSFHPEKIQDYKMYKLRRRLLKKRAICAVDDASCSTHSQLQFEKNISAFIINTLTPPTLLQHTSFLNLFKSTNYKVPNQQTLLKNITETHDAQMNELKSLIQNSNFLCNTSNIWSNGKITFLGVTIHFLDEDLKRYSAAIACKRLSSVYDHKRIEEILENINLKFGIAQHNIVASISSVGSTSNEPREKQGSIDTESEDEDDDSFKLINSNESNTKHIRCGTDILNLIGIQDYQIAVKSNDVLENRDKTVFSKCSHLWRKTKRQKSAEIINDVLGFSLSSPSPNQFSSIYNSVSQIIRERAKLPTIFERLGLNYFRETELLYLEEYSTVMKPLAETIHLLQNESNSYYGYLLPSLLSLRIKYEKMKLQIPFKYGGETILEMCLNSLQKRFSNFYDLSNHEAIISAVLLPNFKLRWYNAVKHPTKSIDDIKKVIISSAEHILDALRDTEKAIDDRSSHDQYSDSFFDFDDNDQSESKSSRTLVNNRSKIELELHRYLDDQRSNLSMLNDFEILKKVFRKYNACLPSTSSVERLFSFETITNTPTRNAVTDDVFEKMILLKANKKDSI